MQCNNEKRLKTLHETVQYSLEVCNMLEERLFPQSSLHAEYMRRCQTFSAAYMATLDGSNYEARRFLVVAGRIVPSVPISSLPINELLDTARTLHLAASNLGPELHAMNELPADCTLELDFAELKSRAAAIVDLLECFQRPQPSMGVPSSNTHVRPRRGDDE